MTGTAASLARVQASLVNTRLSEAETLASAGRLNDAKRLQIEALLNKHTIAFDQALDTVSTESPENVSVLTSAMQATFALHAKFMNEFTAYASTTGTSSNTASIEHLRQETDLHVADPRAPWALPTPSATSSDFIMQNFQGRELPAAAISAANRSSTSPDKLPIRDIQKANPSPAYLKQDSK
jgi:hypothetical protein